MVLVAGIVYWRVQTKEPASSQAQRLVDSVGSTPCTPAFRDGGGPYYLPDQPFREDLAPGYTDGEKLIVTGKIFRSDCRTPVANAVLDIWHASNDGNYENEWFRGQVRTNKQGEYRFVSVLPKGYGEGTAYRPPHIHFKVFENGEELVTSQMFFPDVRGKAGFEDAFIMQYERAQEGTNVVHEGYHDIVLP